ncbi:hypothetical protein IAU60_003599 [Kwoniella sp. DSM 27419]
MSRTTPDSTLVEQLKELGISERTARFALSKTGNNVTRAANYGECSCLTIHYFTFPSFTLAYPPSLSP